VYLWPGKPALKRAAPPFSPGARKGGDGLMSARAQATPQTQRKYRVSEKQMSLDFTLQVAPKLTRDFSLVPNAEMRQFKRACESLIAVRIMDEIIVRTCGGQFDTSVYGAKAEKLTKPVTLPGGGRDYRRPVWITFTMAEAAEWGCTEGDGASKAIALLENEMKVLASTRAGGRVWYRVDHAAIEKLVPVKPRKVTRPRAEESNIPHDAPLDSEGGKVEVADSKEEVSEESAVECGFTESLPILLLPGADAKPVPLPAAINEINIRTGSVDPCSAVIRRYASGRAEVLIDAPVFPDADMRAWTPALERVSVKLFGDLPAKTKQRAIATRCSAENRTAEEFESYVLNVKAKGKGKQLTGLNPGIFEEWAKDFCRTARVGAAAERALTETQRPAESAEDLTRRIRGREALIEQQIAAMGREAYERAVADRIRTLKKEWPMRTASQYRERAEAEVRNAVADEKGGRGA
jgi:hypothetical protein